MGLHIKRSQKVTSYNMSEGASNSSKQIDRLSSSKHDCDIVSNTHVSVGRSFRSVPLCLAPHTGGSFGPD